MIVDKKNEDRHSITHILEDLDDEDSPAGPTKDLEDSMDDTVEHVVEISLETQKKKKKKT